MATYQDSRYNIALPSGSGGAITLIKTLTASSSATLSFVDGSSDVVLDNTYRTYIFKFINIHGANNGAQFQVGFRDGSTDYDATKTSTFFDAEHNESGSGGGVAYDTGGDLAQGTGFQNLTQDLGNDNDQSLSGELWLFSPSSTTFVKHFIAACNSYASDDRNMNSFISGYCNVTAAIDAVQFKFSGGNIDSGTIKLYGIS